MSYEQFVNNYQRYLKSPRTLSEAVKDAEYCSAIIYPKESEYSVFWGLLGALVAVAIFGYGFFLTISRF